MYGSYGSYSGMPAPMDISPRSSYSSRPQDAPFAFPSWPRRSSLSSPNSDFEEQRATSYISDEDLFFADTFESDFDARSVSSSSSNTPYQQGPDPVELARLRVLEQAEKMRLVAMAAEKAKRQQQAMRKSSSRRNSSSSKKGSLKTKLASMTPIAEAE